MVIDAVEICETCVEFMRKFLWKSMVPQRVWISISIEMPDESMAGLVYPIGCRMKALPANAAQHTYRLAY